MTAHGPRFNRRVLTVFLLVALPVLIVGVALALASGQARLSASYAQHLEQVAQKTAADVDAYVYRRILDAALLGRTPDIRRLSASGSSRHYDTVREAALDKEWQELGRPPQALAGLLDNSVSEYFRDIVSQDRIYRELLLTDKEGRLLAASNPTADYLQSDEDWWKATADSSSGGRMTVSDVRWYESSGTHAIEIAVPVYGPGSDVLAGVLKVVTDSRELLAAIGGVQLGATGEAVLVRDNGSIVFARRTTVPGARFFAAKELGEKLEAMRKSGPVGGTFFDATGPDGATYLVGLSESQLGRSYPNINWIVAVSQARDELLAPVNSVGWYLLWVFGLLGAFVMGLALWFSMRLAEPQVAVDMALVHPQRVAHVGEVDEEEQARETRAH
jgi:hypothetical protein